METGGDEGLIERVVDSKDLQQQSKAFDKLTDRVEDRQLDSTRVQEVLSLSLSLCIFNLNWVLFVFICFGFLWLWLMTWQAMASIAASSEADWNAMKMRYIQTTRIDFQNFLYI